MTCNTLMAGEIGSGAKQAVNEAVDETADSIGDSVRREVKRGSVSATEMAKPQGGCFTGGTLIPTVKGEKAIREIRVDDLVLSENPETGERGYKEVRRLYLHESRRPPCRRRSKTLRRKPDKRGADGRRSSGRAGAGL